MSLYFQIKDIKTLSFIIFFFKKGSIFKKRRGRCIKLQNGESFRQE